MNPIAVQATQAAQVGVARPSRYACLPVDLLASAELNLMSPYMYRLYRTVLILFCAVCVQVQRLQKQYEEIAALAAAAGLQLDDPLRGGPAPPQKQQPPKQQQKQGAPAAPAAAAAAPAPAAAAPPVAAAPVSKAPQPKAIEVGEGGSKVSESESFSVRIRTYRCNTD
jgi:hypothetical protein